MTATAIDHRPTDTTSMAAGSATDIVVLALNARWSHASLAARCLKANLRELEDRCTIVERTIDDRAADVVEALALLRPRVLGLSVYIWNATLMAEVAELVRAVLPDTLLVVGGPEVSHEVDDQQLCALAHHVVRGEGEDAFYTICDRVLGARKLQGAGGLVLQLPHVVDGGRPELSTLSSPYRLYDDVDLQQRVVYVEASRGCPFTCQFCLSSLDEVVRTYPLDAFLDEMQALIDRGLRAFKFIDRTFNLKIDTTERILRFFLERAPLGVFAHFEMVPDRLPESLRALLAQFPPGAVQLEVGIQTLDDEVSKRIARRQNVEKLEDNLRFLSTSTGVHIHADLIVGLPGEDLATFARGFDRLFALGSHEIQVGILKRLRGAPIARHTEEHAMVYAKAPPYEVIQTGALPFVDVQRLKRFARYYDLVQNNGRFPKTAALVLSPPSPFFGFLDFADWLWAETGAKHGIALPRLGQLLGQYLVEQRGLPHDDVHAALLHDFGRDKIPTQLAAGIPKRQRRHAQGGDAAGA